MYGDLSSTALQDLEDDIVLKFLDRKWALDAAGVPPTHDKLFCFFKWQLDEIEKAKDAREGKAAA